MDSIQNDHVILVAEGVFNSKWLSGWRKRVTEIKLKKELKFGEGAAYEFGIPDSDAIESWDKGMKLMRRSNSMRKVQWTVHYQL